MPRRRRVTKKIRILLILLVVIVISVLSVSFNLLHLVNGNTINDLSYTLLLQPDRYYSTNKKSAIVTLISNHTTDIEGLSNAIYLLEKNVLNDNSNINDVKTPIIVFHQGDLTTKQRTFIVQKSTRPISFPIVNDFDTFPSGFDPRNEKTVWAKRSKWGYQQMCRFWVSQIWNHPAIQPHETIMRIDSDSCFLKKLSRREKHAAIPGLSNQNIVYHPNLPILHDAWPNHGLWETILEYIKRNKIRPKHEEYFRLAQKTWNESSKLLMFQNNLEIDRISFFQSSEVKKFQNYLVEEEPSFGIFRKRWGDAPIRFLTLALFATPEQIESSTLIPGYKHGKKGGCNVKDIRIWMKRSSTIFGS